MNYIFMTCTLYLDKLWKFDIASKQLSTKKRMWQYQSNNWVLPAEGTSGHIVDSSGDVLDVAMNEANIPEYVVTLKNKLDQMNGGQIWLRSQSNSEGYFTLKNQATGKFLTVHTFLITSVSGRISC